MHINYDWVYGHLTAVEHRERHLQDTHKCCLRPTQVIPGQFRFLLATLCFHQHLHLETIAMATSSGTRGNQTGAECGAYCRLEVCSRSHSRARRTTSKYSDEGLRDR